MVKADYSCLIIGSGFSGLDMAIKLKTQLLEHNFAIIEKEKSVGGTWLVNQYPGAGCDVPSHFYSLSYEPNPDWSHVYSFSDEISAYVDRVARKYDIHKHCLFETECVSAIWDEKTELWNVKVRDLKTGTESTKTSTVVVSAVGVLGVPADPPIPGIEQFEGRVMHTAKWDRHVDLHNKNVVVIGNGCSATQATPVIAKEAKHLKQFIRSSHYYLEQPQAKYSKFEKWLCRNMPLYQRFFRFIIYFFADIDFRLFYTRLLGLRNAQKKIALKYLHETAPEKYHKVLTPDFELGQKRRVYDTNYLKTLHRDNVELTNVPLEKFTQKGIQTIDGQETPADIVVLANGFKTQDFLVPMKIVGQAGESLEGRWKKQGGARAYLGAAVARFPNFFLLVGPNTVQGHFSVVFTIECNVNYVIQLIRPILREKQIVSVKEEAEASYNRWIKEELSKTVFTQPGATGWYSSKESGHNPTIYPSYQTHYWWHTLKPKWKDFELEARA
ncbi:4-hydroxyacetophenone monooxygenase [Protomyces lactucae-debilis]|uniref:4-hydroxyacetophenone monooxygenase n=1 Tax=Protomyces lactucae-debilis TaxID=2754530 RepID=A0A1Y2FGM1_PROLT|nr:4-hydroxyacetophenone monooxygenase [Protomyces lactucae-debilis]ORY83081.1 4-hydroxyacetophenone monooxygenase [Protomyces lactucae-debilis]